MKKGFILTTALAMVLGVGVAVGAHHAKVTKVEAGNTYGTDWYVTGTVGGKAWGDFQKISTHNTSESRYEIQLTMTTSSEFKIFNSASYSGHQINRASSNLDYNNKGWLEYTDWAEGDNFKMKEAGDFVIWFVDNITEYDNVDWGFGIEKAPEPTPEVEYNVTCVVDGKAEAPIKVGEGLLPDAKPNTYAQSFDGWYTASDYKTKLTAITADCSVYGRFVDKATASYTIDDGYAKKFDAYYLHAWNSDGDNGGWPGVELEGKTITIPTDASFIINDGNGQQTVNITQEGAKAYVRLLNTTDESGHYNVEWKEAAQDVPASEGYYIKGSASGWAYSPANKMSTEDLHEGDVAQFIGFTAKAGDQIRICSYYTDRAPFEQWADLQNGTSEVGTKVGDNLQFTADGEYDVYAKYIEDRFYFDVVAHAEPEPDPVFTVVNRTFDPVTFVLDEDEKPEGVKHQYSAQLQYALRGGELKFYADGVQITEHIGVDAGDEEHVNNVYGNATDGFRIRHTCNYSGYTKVYLKTYEDGGCSIWGDGYDVDFFSVTVKTDTTTAYNLVKDETFEPNETYIEQFKTTKAVPMKAMSGEDWDTSNGIMCDGLAPAVAPEEAAGNNAMAAFQATAWKVHNDCEEVIYLKIKRTDLSIMMYIGGYEEAHVLTIGGKTVNLTKSSETEYAAHGVALNAGDAVTSYTIEGVAQTVTSKAVGNNNLTEDKKVVANVESADIYYNVEAKTLWISGLPAAGQHLLKNGNTAIEMTHTDPYEGYDQYASGLLTFAANDTIKVLDTSSASSYAVTWCPSIVATSTKLAGKFVYDSEKHEMKCVTACSAAVYLKIKSGVDEVYFGDVPEYIEEAVDYVNHFKSVMSTVCGDSPNKKNNVEAGWSNLAGDFRALSEQAQAEVKLGGYSLVEEIQEFGERYIAIKQQHPNWTLENFLEWDIPASGRYAGVDLELSTNNNMMVIIIAIAATSAIALTALLVIKKRRHH